MYGIHLCITLDIACLDFLVFALPAALFAIIYSFVYRVISETKFCYYSLTIISFELVSELLQNSLPIWSMWIFSSEGIITPFISNCLDFRCSAFHFLAGRTNVDILQQYLIIQCLDSHLSKILTCGCWNAIKFKSHRFLGIAFRISGFVIAVGCYLDPIDDSRLYDFQVCT